MLPDLSVYTICIFIEYYLMPSFSLRSSHSSDDKSELFLYLRELMEIKYRFLLASFDICSKDEIRSNS